LILVPKIFFLEKTLIFLKKHNKGGARKVSFAMKNEEIEYNVNRNGNAISLEIRLLNFLTELSEKLYLP
jgi:hypothetical protein